MKSLAIVVVAALSCVAFAEGPEGGARPEGARRASVRHEGMGPSAGAMDPLVRMVSNPVVAEKIGLSEEQKAKLKELNKGPATSRELQKKVHEAMGRQVELMKADKIDEAAVMAAIDEVFELRKAMAKEQAKRVIAVKSILTPEQVKKAHEEMRRSAEARGERGPRREGKAPRKGPRGEKGPKEGGEGPAPAPKAE